MLSKSAGEFDAIEAAWKSAIDERVARDASVEYYASSRGPGGRFPFRSASLAAP
jgi:hypothetical protein